MNKFLICLLLFAPTFAQAKEGTGLGVLLGIPSGVSVRHWFHEDRSMDVAAGWSLANTSRFIVHADYLWSKDGLIELGEEKLDLYFGAGLGVRTKSGKGDEVVFGPRVPVGVSYFFTDPVIEAFGQVGLNLGIIPSSDLYLDAGVGVRFYF
jgi:hypothetical protein